MKILFNSRNNLVFITTLFTISLLHAQSVKENWVKVSEEDDNKLYINSAGLINNQDDDIYVWVLEEFYSPLQLEGVDDNISYSKTYYLFNKQKRRYSILQVIYFDEDKNVLKNYSYEQNSDLQDFKYNTPIIEDSSADLILKKCEDIIK